jgi:hypothetical protein
MQGSPSAQIERPHAASYLDPLAASPALAQKVPTAQSNAATRSQQAEARYHSNKKTSAKQRLLEGKTDLDEAVAI